MTQKIRVGVIGFGYWGPNLTRNFIELPSTELVAVADLSAERRKHVEQRYPSVYTTDNFADFFDAGIDAVAIATPPATHHKIAKACLEHGLHCLIEKPLAHSVAEAEDLIAVAERKNVRLMAGHTFEYSPAVREIRRLIDAGELGDIYYIDSVRTNLGLFQPNTDAMWDLAPHDISIAHFLLRSSPKKVTAQGGSFVSRAHGQHDVVYLHVEYGGGKMASIRVSWLDPNKTRRTTIVGSKKMLVYDDIETLEKIRIYDRGVDVLPYTDTFGEFQCSYRYGDVTIPHVSWSEPLRIECQHFADCVVNGTTPQSDGRSGLEVVKVLEAAKLSIRLGGTVDVDRLEVTEAQGTQASYRNAPLVETQLVDVRQNLGAGELV